MTFILFRSLQVPQNFRSRRIAQQQMAMNIAHRFFANATQHFNAMQVTGIAFRAILTNYENHIRQQSPRIKQVIFVFVIFFIMDKVAIDIAATHHNNRAFITFKRTQDTFKLVARTKHKHMTANIDMLFSFAHGFRCILENVNHDADEQHRKNNVARQKAFPAE